MEQMMLDAGASQYMLSGRNFIVFSDDWGRHPFSCQHIMQHLIPHNNVLWVHTIGMRRPRFSTSDVKRSVEKLRSFLSPAQKQQDLPENITILSPPMLPFGNKVIRLFNRHSVVDAVRKRVKGSSMTAPIVLTTLPNASEYLGHFGECLVVYYCVDDFTLWPGVNEPLVRQMERRLLEKADVLFCSSPELAALKRRSGLRTEVLPHGVDYDHFSSRPIPINLPELTKLSHPVIGYFGLLGEWVDTTILESVALAHPDWSVLIIGQVVADTRRLRQLPNVLFTGPVPYEELPSYVAHVDALVLPYHVQGRGQTITPLKLREYIATGKPVVSTAVPECTLYHPHIAIARSNQFAQTLELVLREPGEVRKVRQQMVSGESWANRAEFLSRCICEVLESKNGLRSAP